MRTILLVSDDRSLQLTRALVLEDAGYRTVSIEDLAAAMSSVDSERPRIVVLGNTFSVHEQDAFVAELWETHSDIRVLCLRPGGVVQPQDLLLACDQCFNGKPDFSRVRIMNGEPIAAA